MIKLNNITKSYNESVVLKDLSLTVRNGERIAIMGESGRGKTSLLRIICKLESADSGEVILDGKISVVFQEDRLFADWSVYQNVYSVCRNHQTAKEVLQGVLLWDDKDKHPSELSGGMARRVAIARALAFEHDILILDEPFKGLDQATRQRVAEFISSYEKDNTILMVTHDKNEAECINANVFDLI